VIISLTEHSSSLYLEQEAVNLHGKMLTIMQEGKRQKQVAALLQEQLSGIFQRLGLSMIQGVMVSITSVKMSPDLFEARVHVSFYKAKDAQATMQVIQDKAWEIKRELVSSVKHQLRSMPQLSFHLDESLDYVDKMEALFKKIKEDPRDS
jgi:ribosome-binding factor A